MRPALVLVLCASCAPAPPPPAPPVTVAPPASAASPRALTLPELKGADALPDYTSMPDGPPPPPPAPAPAAAPAPPPAPAPRYVSPNTKEAAACRARGGELRPVCMAGDEMCVLRFRDAGKKCRDKKDCTGNCLFVGSSPTVGAAATGECEPDNDPCGCMAVIKGGKIVSNDCRD